MRFKGRWLALAVVLVIVGYVGWQQLRPAGSEGRVVDAPIVRIVPDSIRIKVEVLNATTKRGLARRGTFVMRDLGFDVVNSGNSGEELDSTTVIVRNGRMDWGELAAQGLGGARVIARPDTSRYLDLTILLGTTWRPLAQTFHP